MAYKPTRMDQIKKIVEYHQQGIGKKRIARLLGMSKNTVKQYISRVENRAIELKDLDKGEGYKEIYRSDKESVNLREEDLKSRIPSLIKELPKVGVTRYLLWEEYKLDYPDGFSYSRFCRKIKQYRKVLNATIRLEHKAADYLTVDFTGKKISWVEKLTGEVHTCEVLVCTLPYSGYTFAYAVESQRQEDFIHAINQAFLYIGGLPRVLLSDNLKSFVTKADRYEPTFSELCVQFSSHYGIELEAARAGKPKDKAHVERHVNIVYNRLFAPFRNEIFYSIYEINKAFLTGLEKHNKQNYQGKTYSRKDLFDKDEKPHLLALPKSLFEVKKSTQAKVQPNYHVVLGEDKRQYSVPCEHIGKTTKIIYTSQIVEVYLGIERIAIHKRNRSRNGYTTTPGHMPEKHKKYLEQRGWDAAYFSRQAEKIGPNTKWAIEQILQSKNLIEQTYNSCLGVIRLSNKYTPERLENACIRAKTTHRVNYGILKNILTNNMDLIPIKEERDLFTIPVHDNIRGPNNYN